jgi:hypothetical protein
MSVKAEFIEKIRATPDGISGFLTKPIPALEDIAMPTDVDSSILAQGKFCVNVNKIALQFVGLTLVELILRVGQHSNVAEALLFAGLEYLQASNAQQDFVILEPADGQAYTPGNVRLRAKAKNGTLTQVAVEVGSKAVALDNTDGVFEGFVALETVGDYTATFSALFDDQATKTASVSFTLAEAAADDPPDEQPQPPGGTDTAALQALTTKIYDLISIIIRNPIMSANNSEALKNAFTDLCNVAINLKGNSKTINTARNDFTQTWALFIEAWQMGRTSDMEYALANIKTIVATVVAATVK